MKAISLLELADVLRCRNRRILITTSSEETKYASVIQTENFDLECGGTMIIYKNKDTNKITGIEII
jgi:hypothetical protein